MPPTLRRTSGGRVRDGVEDAPALASAEREAVAILAEYARRRGKLRAVWVFTHAGADPGELRGVARARASGTAHFGPDAEARAVAGRALEASRGRFARRVASLGEGLHVALAEPEGRPAVSVVASAPGGARLEPDAETALVDLAEIAARIIGPSTTETGREETSTAATTRAGGYGAGLADALALLERPPVLAESRARLERALGSEQASIPEAIRALETDIGLAVAVTRAANRAPARPRGGIASVPGAIKALGAEPVLEVAAGLPTLPAFGAKDALGMALTRMSSHAIATRVAVDLVARQVGAGAAEELRLVALLHDVGKLALAAAGAEQMDLAAQATVAPDDRVAAERRLMGIDHAALGAIALQRLGLPKRTAVAVERHHAHDASGAAGVVRLADMLAHQAHGDAVSRSALVDAGRALGLGPPRLGRLAYDVTRMSEPGAVGTEPSPLTPAQQKVLEGLAGGMTYKQIAAELSLSVSTVRSHLHRVYERLDVADRAQAVLLARERGWL